MEFDEKLGEYMGGYLLSDDFKHLCRALDLDRHDRDDIRQKVLEADDETCVEDLVALLVHEKHGLAQRTPSKDALPKQYLHDMLHGQSSFFNKVCIRNPDRWEDIKNKLHAGISSGKINSVYLLMKEFDRELDSMSISKVDDALKDIYILELNKFIERHILDIGIKKTLLRQAFQSEYYANPLYFDELNYHGL